METEEEAVQNEQELIPVEQETLEFYGKPIIVVRLPDGRPAVVIRFLCENMGIAPRAQIHRIRTTEVIANDLAYAQVQTEGGPQRMAVIVLHGATYWLATIDPKRVRAEVRADILRYQHEAVDVLYAWASTPKNTTTALVPADPMHKPAVPAETAPRTEWIIYHQQMLRFLEWQESMEVWRGDIEGRLEVLEAGMSTMGDLIPDILYRMPPPTLTPEHQRKVQIYVHQLNQLTNKPYGTIYNTLKTVFSVPKYQDVPESDWPQLEQWFLVQLERARKQDK